MRGAAACLVFQIRLAPCLPKYAGPPGVRQAIGNGEIGESGRPNLTADFEKSKYPWNPPLHLCDGPGLADSGRGLFYAATAGAFSASYWSGER